LHKDLSKDDSYPPGKLNYSEIGSNILTVHTFRNEVSLRIVLNNALISTLFRPQSGMSSNRRRKKKIPSSGINMIRAMMMMTMMMTKAQVTLEEVAGWYPQWLHLLRESLEEKAQVP